MQPCCSRRGTPTRTATTWARSGSGGPACPSCSRCGPGALRAAARWKLDPENVVTYTIDRRINYTNVCVADCKFCAFYRRPQHDEGSVLSFEQIGRKLDELRALGGVQIPLQGGHNPY